MKPVTLIITWQQKFDVMVKTLSDLVFSSNSSSTENEAEFKNIGNCRIYVYRYSGGEDKAKLMSTPLQEHIELLKPQLSNPESVVNSCLITR